MKTTDSLPQQYIIDLTPAIPFLEACEAADNIDDIIEYQLWCDHHDLECDALEEAMEKIQEQLPHLYPGASNYVARYLVRRFLR